jgi:hypothetical protein
LTTAIFNDGLEVIGGGGHSKDARWYDDDDDADADANDETHRHTPVRVCRVDVALVFNFYFNKMYSDTTATFAPTPHQHSPRQQA